MKNDHKIQPPSPLVYFVCTGHTAVGKQKHRLVHLGATKERLGWWPELAEQRQAARNDLIGSAAIRAWARRLNDVISVEKDLPGHEAKEALRKAILLRNWGIMTMEQGNLAQTLLNNPLRECGQHQGQAFLHSAWQMSYPIACCYLCKLSIAYDEVKKDVVDTGKETRLETRLKVPHSCAEVPASGWCDSRSQDYQEEMPKETSGSDMKFEKKANFDIEKQIDEQKQIDGDKQLSDEELPMSGEGETKQSGM